MRGAPEDRKHISILFCDSCLEPAAKFIHNNIPHRGVLEVVGL